MSLKKDVFRCTVVYDHEQKESAPIEIDAKRVNNTVTLSLVITNQTPEKGLMNVQNLISYNILKKLN